MNKRTFVISELMQNNFIMDRGQGKISCKLSRFTGDCSYARNTFRSYIFIYYL
jgi:hypothetical protein